MGGWADWFLIIPRRLADVLVRMPDEMTCQKLKHKLILPNPCSRCLACECMLLGWLANQSVRFEQIPWVQGFLLGKMCGPETCVSDWPINEKTIRNGYVDKAWLAKEHPLPAWYKEEK